MIQTSDNASFSQDLTHQRTNSRQTQLQSKLNSYFENRKTSKQHTRSASNRPSYNQTMDFRILFNKVEKESGENKHGKQIRSQKNNLNSIVDRFNNNRQNKDDIANVERNIIEDGKKRGAISEIEVRGNRKDVKESLGKKKLNLMEQKVKQLEQEVELELQKKLDIFKQNEQLEREIKRIDGIMKSAQKEVKVEDEFNYEILELETNLRRQKERNKAMKKQVQQLKQMKKSKRCSKTQDSINKNSYESQKNTLQIERLKVQLEEERRNYRKLKEKFENNRELKCLSSELKKLRKMVEAKPKRGKY